MNRRNFLFAGAVAAATPLTAIAVGETAEAMEQAPTTQSPAGTPLWDISLTEAAARMRARTVTSRQLTEACLERIATYNPKVNAYITVLHEQSLAQADALDKEAAAGHFRGPLHGIPIALKDNIDTAGIRTTAASEVFDDRVPTEDAEVVRRLKLAGAVLLGKTNMHEFANGHTSASTYFRPVRNPWALDRIPAGSSGGSGAAVISGMAFGALGTDTGGSVRMPAAYCNMVGLKPTYGLVSIRGIIPLTYSLDHCGPMTRTVEDAALMLNAMTGYDKLDVASVEHPAEDYVASMRKQKVSTLRIGVPRAPYFDFLDADIEKAVNDAIAVIAKMTAGVHDMYLPATAGFAALALGGEREAYQIDLYRRNAGRYSISIRTGLEAQQKSMNDTSTETCSEKVVDYVLSNWDLIRTRKTIDDSFVDCDLVVLPTMRLDPRTINDALAREEKPEPREPETDNNNTPFNIFGIPAISIPCGFSATGLPIGLMIAGPRFSEARVLALAAAYERATEWHTMRPKLTPDMAVPALTRKS
jgi:aspartyl-tRNA(Asn)/glutamyl-tRNA(Gln) amidotransferase subunit A